MLLALFCLLQTPAFAGQTEIKVGLYPEDFLHFLQTQNLGFDQAQEGAYYYYDTPALDLFKNRLIVRARTWSARPLKDATKGDFTAKIRPIDLSAVPEDWYKTPGFKCEYDLGATAPVPACEVKEERIKKDIFDVARGEQALSTLVSSAQNRFLDNFLGAPPLWDSLAILGPVHAFVWELYFSKNAPKATLEYWVLPDNSAFGEVSMKVPGEGAYAERDRLMTYLRDNGIVKYTLDETKTKWVLDYFSARLKRLYYRPH